MYLVSLHGHATSCSPSMSGWPTECRAGTNVASSSSMRRSTWVPMRAMTRIETVTYAESVISTPNIGFSASRWPITNGITYIVRPRMDPSYSLRITAFISPGSIQLFVGPASRSSTEQMKVRSSTRATSVGSEAAWKEFGLMAGFSRVKVPVATRASVSCAHSSSEPVHQWMRSGWVIAATSWTKWRIPWWVVGWVVEGAVDGVGEVSVGACVSAVMAVPSRAFAADASTARDTAGRRCCVDGVSWSCCGSLGVVVGDFGLPHGPSLDRRRTLRWGDSTVADRLEHIGSFNARCGCSHRREGVHNRPGFGLFEAKDQGSARLE